MERLPLVAITLLAVPVVAGAQRNRPEDEVRALLVAYDSAVSARNIAFLERVLSDDYVLTGAGGRKSSRAQALQYYTAERDRPSYRRISLQHDNVVIRAVSDMAVVTNDYVSRTAPLDAPGAEPEVTQGRHTGVFAKRNGRWMVIAEQDTERPHDGTLIERQVAARGHEYYELTKRLADGRRRAEPEQRADIAAFSRLLADEYACACGEVGISHKAQALDRYKVGRITLESVELLEQSVVAIDNNAAVETGKVRWVGVEGGQRLDTVQRYTRTWVAWSQGWQVIAEQTSTARN